MIRRKKRLQPASAGVKLGQTDEKLDKAAEPSDEFASLDDADLTNF